MEDRDLGRNDRTQAFDPDAEAGGSGATGFDSAVLTAAPEELRTPGLDTAGTELDDDGAAGPEVTGHDPAVIVAEPDEVQPAGPDAAGDDSDVDLDDDELPGPSTYFGRGLRSLPGRLLMPAKPTSPEKAEAFERKLLGSMMAGVRIEGRLGRGATGCVFLGRHVALQMDVAVKVLDPALFFLRSHVGQFFEEARAAATLDHANIVGIYDVGQERGIYFIVMQYVKGETLEDLVQRETQVEEDVVVRIAIETAGALAEVHERGILHRDIKPSNLLLDERGRVKIADFGLASRLLHTPQATGRSEVAGTPHYIPPEQLSGGKVDRRADLYSLGATLYFALTGVRPFEGDTVKEVLLKHLTMTPAPVRSLVPTVSEDMGRIIEKLLAKRPDLRHSSADELLRDLHAIGGKERP